MVAKYTTKQVEFLERVIPTRRPSEVVVLFNKCFGTNLKECHIKSFMDNRKIRNGRDTRFMPGGIPYNKGIKRASVSPATEFKKGNRPFNWRPVGSERINKYGYVEIKTAEPRTWKTKHQVIWEEKNGALPKGHVIIFADGNKLNMRLSNLLLVSRRELVVMNKFRLISNDRILTEIGKSVADIKILIAERKK
ncbi:MAG: HNH endonuclease [Spirochaetaceae bacterium]|jgi:hypothetical protein|nr:HNH endonuclease [Spirochaetaceae bacterium]